MAVKISGTGLESPETRITTVELQIGDKVYSQSLNLVALLATGQTEILFPVVFEADQAGELKLVARVNPSDSPTEKERDLNKKQQKMYVLCTVENVKGKEVPFRAQSQLPWANDPYGNVANSSAPGTMKNYGCSVTAFEMIMEFYGILNAPRGSPASPYSPVPGLNLPGLGGEKMDPGILNKAFTNYRTNALSVGSTALNEHNNPIWEGMADVAREAYKGQCESSGPVACDPSKVSSILTFSTVKKTFNNANDSSDHKAVEKEICSGNPVILKFSKTGGGQHFMLATGMAVDASGNKIYRLNNPGSAGSGNRQLQSAIANSYPSIIGYVKYKSSADPSMMFISAPDTVHFIVKDAQGRRTGYDPNAKINYEEIPGASYGLQSIDTPADNGEAHQTLVSERYFNYSTEGDIPVGEYAVTVFALVSGSYYLEYRGYDSKGNTNAQVIKTGVLQAGNSSGVTLMHSAEAIPQVNAEFKLKDYSIKKKPRNNFSQSDVRLAGKLSKLDKSKIEIKDNIKVSIGGVNGYSLSISAKDIRVKKHKTEIIYSYKNRYVDIEVSNQGDFKIALEKADLSNLDKAQMSYVSLKLDTVFGDARANIECRKNVCKIPLRGHQHCHFDKEDEE